MNTLTGNQELFDFEFRISKHISDAKNSKQKYKQLPKNDKKQLQNLTEKFLVSNIMDIMLNDELSTNTKEFCEYMLSLALNIPNSEITIDIEVYKQTKFIVDIMQDKAFKNHLMYSLITGNDGNNIGLDIFAMITSYILKDKKLTIKKIQNLLSWYLAKSGIILKVDSKLTQEQQTILEQITIGIKYEKEKNINPVNRLNYKKKPNKYFSIANITDNFIKIKYISKQDYRHRFHKSPMEHQRQGHYREYKNGNKVWINTSIINQGVA